MILLFLLVNATYQTVIYQFQANFNIIDGWEDLEGYSSFFTCGVHKYFGSPNNFFFISRIFVDLEPHSHIKIEAEFLRIDDYAPLYFAINFIKMDYALVVSDQNNICGNSNSEQIHTISLIYSHNRRSIWIDTKFYNGGLKSFTLSIIKCQYESAGCIENYPNHQFQWKLHQYSFNYKLITNFDGWTFATNYITNLFCGRCQFVVFTQITYSTQIPPHQYILIRFFKDDWNTIIVDYLYGEQTISTNYLVEILITNHYGPVFILDIKTQSNSIYSKIRDFELFYSQSEVQIQSFKEGCLEQVYDTCLICREGWIQDEFLENCIPICGDGIIQGQEECDDANLISNYFCYKCKFKCIEFCQICQFGMCLQCVDGFEFSLNRQRCIPLCNDGIISQFEICDDQNNIQFDGCYKCQQNCDLRCQLCIDQKCQFCEIGWELRDNKCYSICGDGLIIQYSSEQCDDGNQIKNDGCFDCLLECKSNCLICLNYQVCILCQDHYQLEGQSCIPICGDGIIIAGFEDCDDGNFEPNDGCYQCKYECSLGCLDCEKGGFCKKCDNQYILNNQTAQCQQIEYLNNQNQDIDKNKDEIKNPLDILCQRNFILIDDKCVNQCGNGLLQEQEKCDDGNDQPADGCQDCLIQQNWKCITIIRDSPSQCTYVKAPNLVINYLNMTQNKQYISIQFNEQVKILTNQLLSETINFELLNIDKKKWNSNLNIIQDVGLYMSFGEYVVQIEVYQLLEFRPILKILLNQTVVNINNAALEDFERSITLQYPKYLDEKQKDYSTKLKSLNQYIIYGLSGITGVNLLLGSGELFVEILGILQFQQYLRYINLQFPENLEIYFSINDMITVQPLLDFMQFQQFLKFINIESNQEYSDGKFNLYKQNSSLIINLQCQIIQGLIFLFLILLFKWIKNVIYKSIFCSKYFQFMSSLSQYINSNIIFKFSKSFYNICLTLLKLENYISFQGIQKALLLNGWDMIFKTLLYTRNIQTQNYLDILQLIIASIILIFYFIILLNIFEVKYKFTQINKILRFEILSFSRQFFFLTFLIYFQNSQILQLGLLFLTSIFQIKFIYNYRFIFNQKNYIVQMVVEISVLAFIISSFLYIEEFTEYFNEEKKILLGLIQIIILSKGVIIELILIVWQFLKFIYKLRKDSQVVSSQLFS